MAKHSDGTRVKRTYREIFIDTLKAEAGRAGALVPNGALRRHLGWDEERYQQVKDQLIAEARLTIGKGRGGSVALIAPRANRRSNGHRRRSRPSVARGSRRTNRAIFLDKLTELSNSGKSLVGNGILCDELGWDEDRYRRVKEQLVEEGLLIVGRGHGGMVGLAASPESNGLTLFVSYSHVDEELKNELMKHLEPLRRRKQIDAWHDRKIKAGDEWEKAISDNLKKADIILLLISIDFINSRYCYDNELESAMERHDKTEAIVVPIILRSCLWHNTPFAKLQALPKDGKAVASCADRDDALTAVAEGIRQIAETRLASR